MPYSNALRFFVLLLLLSSFQLKASDNQNSLISDIRKERYARFHQFELDGIHEIGAVSGFVQDRYGYMWMAGEKGLGRFDGYRFKVYKGDSLNGYLPSSEVNKLKLDIQGNLWVATNGGLSRYIIEKDHFETVYGEYQASVKNQSTYAVRAFLFQGDSFIWLASQHHALIAFDRKTSLTKVVVENYGIDQPYYRYHHLERISENQLIFGGRSRGPYIYNIETDSLVHLPVDNNDVPDKKRENDVSVLLKEGSLNYWIGGFDGLYLYNLDQNTFSKYWQGSVYDLMLDKTGNYWLGTGNGILQFNTKSGKAVKFQKNNDDPKSLGGTRIYAVFQDRSGRIWIGHNSGVSTYEEPPNGVQYLFHIPGDIHTPASSSVAALANAGETSFWIGTTDAGLDLYDLATERIQHYSQQQRKDILSNNIRCLFNDKQGNVYIGYWSGRGFGVYNSHKKTFKNYTYNHGALLDDWYNDFTNAEAGNMWLGFWGGPGLTLFDPKKGSFDNRAAKYLKDTYLARRIEVLFTDVYQRLWIGTTQSGIQRLDTESKQAISFFSATNPDGGFHDLQVLAIAQSSDSTLYASSKTGLYKFNEVDNRFQKVELTSNYGQIEIYAMHPDKAHLWLITSKGLLRYNTLNDWISDYSRLVDLQFSKNNAAIIELPDGKLVTGGANGIAILQPEILGLNHALPQIFFTQLQIAGKKNNYFINHTKSINLSWNENFLSIYFGTDKWDKKSSYGYLYRMEGFDKDWQLNTSNQGFIQYTNVPPGKYLFKMKAADTNSQLSGNEISLELIIRAPWWQQAWFKALIALMGVFALIGLWKLRMFELQQKLQNMTLNQKLLRLQMNPHFIFNSLSSIQAFIYSNEQHLAGQYLADFARLIRLILENSRHELITLEREIETIKLYMKLQQLRFENSFDFDVVVDPEIDTETCFVPPMLTQPFLENAVEHGIKTLLIKGKIELVYDRAPATIQVKIIDNGIGLTASGKINQNSKLQHESLSIMICKERLALIEKKSGIKIAFEVKEMRNQDETKGTFVYFEIPANLNKSNYYE